MWKRKTTFNLFLFIVLSWFQRAVTSLCLTISSNWTAQGINNGFNRLKWVRSQVSFNSQGWDWAPLAPSVKKKSIFKSDFHTLVRIYAQSTSEKQTAICTQLTKNYYRVKMNACFGRMLLQYFWPLIVKWKNGFVVKQMIGALKNKGRERFLALWMLKSTILRKTDLRAELKLKQLSVSLS